MNKTKSTFLIIISFIFFLAFNSNDLYSRSYNDFINDFQKALDINFTEDQLNLMFKEYSQLLTPHSDTSKFYNELKGTRILVFPLEEFKKNDLYKMNIKKLINSSNQNHRILAFLIIAASNENSYNDILLDAIKNDKNKGNRIWAGMALLYLQDQHSSELFDFLVNDEEFGDAHMLPLYMNSRSIEILRETAYIKIQNENIKAKILAASILGVTGLNKKTEDILKKAVTDWPIDIKGYAINSLQELKAGNLLNTLKPFLDIDTTRKICLQALSNSPSKEDQSYILNLLPSNKIVPINLLDLLLDSTNNKMNIEWLQLIQTDFIPSDYSPIIREYNTLVSKEMRSTLLKAIPNIKNFNVLAEIARVLRGEKYYNTEEVLISLLKHQNSSVSYWSASSLKGSKSPVLIKMLPDLLKNPKHRAGITDLIIENNISNLQQIYEDILLKEEKGQNWKGSCIIYLAKYPLEKHKVIFRKYLADEKEDWSIRRDAAIGLGRLKDINSVDLIIKVMEERHEFRNSDYNKISYLKALGMIKGEKAKTVIEKYINSEEDIVRELVKEILVKWNE